MLSASRWNRGKKFTWCNRPIRRRVTKLHDWFALVNKYFRGKIMRTSLPLTEIWPISDRFIKQKYYCITVHYRTVCTSENRLGQTVQTGQQTLGHLELFSDYVRWPTPNWIPELIWLVTKSWTLGLSGKSREKGTCKWGMTNMPPFEVGSQNLKILNLLCTI